MAGRFELINAPDGAYQVEMVDGDGTLMAVSVEFKSKAEAVAGIANAREIAETALIRDYTHPRGTIGTRAHGRPVRPTGAVPESRPAPPRHGRGGG
ncbi:YegP family protein [Pseudarthrobacter sp. P1]|uniref:YegP family protein n=1 Tax=Pseudarthrobacter sp. P1 TaxID=3418418 RepID=UPI003CFA90BC